MSQVTISLPDTLNAEVRRRATAAGFESIEDYLVELVRAHCEGAQLESVLESRLEGPFAPLEADWAQRVRELSRRRV